MKTPKKESKISKCQFCGPETSPEICNLSTAKTIVNGKEYSACCVKCSGGASEEKPKKTAQNKARKKQ